MVNRNKRRGRGRRRSARSSGRKIAQVSTGIPITFKRVRGDPPPLNLVSAQTIKVSFDVDITLSQTATPFSVIVASGPNARTFVQLNLDYTSRNTTFYLDRDEVHQAAAVLHFGYQPTGAQINALATEYAIQSCTFYGPVGGGQVRMGIDYGSGMPGAYASDVGTSSVRAVVKTVAPRLWWQKMGSVTPVNDAFAGFWIAGWAPPPTSKFIISGSENYASPGNVFNSVGRIDFVVHVRRSYYTATAAYLSSMKSTDTSQMMAEAK